MQYTYVVYADVLWLLNFGLDLCLLWGTARFGGFLASWWRLALGAALGAFYGVGLLFPALAPLYALPVAVGFSLLLLLVVFGRLPLGRWGWLVGCFYLLSFAMGGAALGVAAVLRRSSWQLFGYRVWELWPALLVALALGRLGIAGFRRLLGSLGLRAGVRLELGGRKRDLSCFFDTGNTLREPAFSDTAGGRAVVLAELGALKGLLPSPLWEELRELYRREGPAARPYQALLRYQRLPGICGRLLLLPYTAVGQGRGLLLGFVPDRLVFRLGDGRQIDASGRLVVGICPLPLAGLKGCRAIVNPEAVLEADIAADIKADIAADMAAARQTEPDMSRERGLKLWQRGEPAPLPPDRIWEAEPEQLWGLAAEQEAVSGREGLLLGLAEAKSKERGRISA